MVNFSGNFPENVIFSNFLKIWMVLDKTIHRAFLEFIKLYKQNPLEKSFIFTIENTVPHYITC